MARSNTSAEMSFKNLVIWLCVLSVLMLIVQMLGQFLTSDILSGSRKVYVTLRNFDYPAILIFDVVFFIFKALSVHILIVAVAASGSYMLCRQSGWCKWNASLVLLLTFLSIWTGIILLNGAWFPRSGYSHRVMDYLPDAVVVATGWSILLLGFVPFILGLISWLGRRHVGIVFVSLVLPLGLYQTMSHGDEGYGKQGEPNVIIIGVDSLRPDVLQSPIASKVIPGIKAFVDDSVIFEDVYTPLARTFPSWFSILSGRYPQESGARSNLISQQKLALDDSLAWRFKSLGYNTVFAMDERRFANFDEYYGFDTIVGPKAGAGDFLLSLFADMPALNVLQSFSLNSHLFPYTHANRALDKLYRPEIFSRDLAYQLKSHTGKPLFLVSHFCLPHWPFEWADSALSRQEFLADFAEGETEGYRDSYIWTLAGVDKQVRHLLASLSEAGALENAIVILLSDHGEANTNKEDSIQTDEANPTIRKLAGSGHGTNVLSAHQNRIVLAFQRFGGQSLQPGRRNQLASTVDIYPTLMELMGEKEGPLAGQIGISLVPWLGVSDRSVVERDVFMETGYYSPLLKNSDIDAVRLFEKEAANYHINSRGLLELSDARIEQIIRGKQRASTNGRQTVAYLPEKEGSFGWYLSSLERNTIIELTQSNFSNECDVECNRIMTSLAGYYGLDAMATNLVQ
ncbi:MAG: sulfatase-like hydrolase/transferase [Pseudomonadales bacterium]